MALSRKEIDRLGKRLRDADVVGVDDLSRLRELRSKHGFALGAVTTILSEELGYDTTSRIKTVGTLLEKLRRMPLVLSQVQDIAGARLVVPDRWEQDLVAERARFDGDLKDRRAEPSFGYRAVHVLFKHDGRRVEVQVRTLLQDLWANLSRD